MKAIPPSPHDFPDDLQIPRLSERLVIRCLPVHYAILFGGIGFGLIVAFLNDHYQWSGHIFPEIEPGLINLLLILICWLVPTILIFALYITHRGCQVIMISAGSRGIELEFSQKRHRSLFLTWEQLTDVQYTRWGLNINYEKEGSPRQLRMSPVFPHQVEDFMGRCHVIFNRRHGDEKE